METSCNTLSIPTRQMWQLSQWPYAINYGTLCTLLASVLDTRGQRVNSRLLLATVFFQNKLLCSQEMSAQATKVLVWFRKKTMVWVNIRSFHSVTYINKLTSWLMSCEINFVTLKKTSDLTFSFTWDKNSGLMGKSPVFVWPMRLRRML